MAKFKIAIPFFITFIILLVIFKNFDIEQTCTIFKTGNINLILIALILFFSTPLILALRWNKLLLAYGVKISYLKTLKYYLANIPISKTSPSGSGDLVRAFYLKNKLSLSGNIGIVIFENLLNILSLLGLVLISSIALKNAILIITSLSLILIIIGLIVYGAKIKINNKKWKLKAEKFFLAKKIITKNPKLLTTSIIYSITPWLIIIVCVKIFFLAFGADLSLLTILITQPIAIFLGLIPITFSGVGVRESAMLYLYSSFAEKSVILAVGLTYSIAAAIFLPLICLPFLIKVLKTKIIYAK